MKCQSLCLSKTNQTTGQTSNKKGCKYATFFTRMSFTYALKLIQPKIAFKQPTTANTARNAKKYVALNGSLKSPSDIVITLIISTTKRGTS